MDNRPSFEIIPNNPFEAIEYYEGYILDLVNRRPKEALNQAFLIELIQNARANIRSLKIRIKVMRGFKID